MKYLNLLFIFIVTNYILHAQKELLTEETLWKLGRVALEDVSPDGGSVVYSVTYFNIVANKGNTDLYVCKTDGTTPPVKITNYEGHENNARFTPDGKKILFLANGLLYSCNPDGSDQYKLADLEMNGFVIAPTNDRIAFLQDVKYRKTTAETYPGLPLANARLYNDLMYRHWKTWDDAHDSNVFTVELKNGMLVGEPVNIVNEPFEAPVEPNDGIEQVSFSPDGKMIAYSCKKYSGKDYALNTNTDIFLYDIQTKSTHNISGFNQGYDKSPIFSPDGNSVLWNAMLTPTYEADKDQLILYNLKSGEKKMLGAKFDNNAEHATFSKDGKFIYFISAVNACNQIMMQDIATAKVKQLTTGIHDYQSILVSPKGLIGSRVSMTNPAEIFSIHGMTGEAVQLTQINKSVWDKIKKAEVRQKWIQTTDGKKMLVWTILPPDFDPKKKYPTLLYCQGGPQSTVSQFFSYRWNLQLMASKGYVIVAPCRRGMPGFGQEWNLAISKDWGGQCMKDYLSAIDDAAKEPFVDKDRLGAVGASFGGYSVYYLAGNHNKRFKCFISHCGVFNLESMYGTTEEMWFVNYDFGGPFWDKAHAMQYEKFSPHKYVQNWDTPIMVMHGEKDFRVPVSEGLQAYQAAQLKNIPSRLVLFPEEGHWIQTPQNGLLWQKEYFGWLDKWLKN